MSEIRTNDSRLWDWTEQLQSFAELSMDIFFIKDIDGRYILANEAAASTMGRRQDEVVGKTDYDLLPKHVARKLRQIDERVMETRTPCTYDRSRIIENTDRVTQVQKFPYVNPNGVVLGVIGIGRDVTETRKIERKLLKEQNRLKSVVELAEDPIYVKGLDGVYLMVNPAFIRDFGLGDEDPVGRTDVDVFGEELGKIFRENDRIVMETEKAVNFEWKGTFHGKPLEFYASKVPYRLPNGKIAGIIGIARDVTELRRMEEQVQEAERVKTGSGVLRNFIRELKQELQELQEEARNLAPSPDLEHLQKRIDKAAELLKKVVETSETLGKMPPSAE